MTLCLDLFGREQSVAAWAASQDTTKWPQHIIGHRFPQRVRSFFLHTTSPYGILPHLSLYPVRGCMRNLLIEVERDIYQET